VNGIYIIDTVEGSSEKVNRTNLKKPKEHNFKD
jgi:hypothetical protein